MDIGDPSEIPARRKPLPSMQELGAFELETESPPSARPGSTAAARTSRSPGMPEAIPAPRPAGAALPQLTPEQLRQALAKADPDTRQKLLSLIVGGRTIQRGGAGLEIKPGSTRSEPPRGGAGTASRGAGQAPRAANPGAAAAGRSASAPLLKIDDHTELLDAAAAPATAQQRKATMQAQLDAALPLRDRPGTDAAAPKVIFPAYDPNRHGEDVRTSARRRPEGPVEGHFPAPRQPLRSTYQHPDGKPMTPEESKAEEVLQAQRCEETLTVLARDGVNGLLLSPRDLDAAVAGGLLDAATAATLWKTWSALRPVVHVIEDEPPGSPADSTDAPDRASTAAPTPDDAPERSSAPGPASFDPGAGPGVPNVGSAPPPTDRPTAFAEPATPPAAAAAAAGPATLGPDASLPWPSTGPAPAWAAQAEPRTPAPSVIGIRHPRARRREALRWALIAFLAYAALTTAWQLGRELWYTGWGWMLLDWLQGFRH